MEFNIVYLLIFGIVSQAKCGYQKSKAASPVFPLYTFFIQFHFHFIILVSFNCFYNHAFIIFFMVDPEHSYQGRKNDLLKVIWIRGRKVSYNNSAHDMTLS